MITLASITATIVLLALVTAFVIVYKMIDIKGF